MIAILIQTDVANPSPELQDFILVMPESWLQFYHYHDIKMILQPLYWLMKVSSSFNRNKKG